MSDHGNLGDCIKLGSRIISEWVKVKSIDGLHNELGNKLSTY